MYHNSLIIKARMLMTKNSLKCIKNVRYMLLYVCYRRNRLINFFYLIYFFPEIFNTIDVCGPQKTNFVLNINKNFICLVFAVRLQPILNFGT